MILAGGQGSRLGELTKKIAKPAVHFGGKYRIIDFPLSNCSNSGIYTVGVLTQYRPLELHKYLGTGMAWNLDRKDGGVFILPPYVTANGGDWYNGTADAVYRNLNFIDTYDPDYVLILSGDHIYTMDYSWMLEEHKMNHADVTIGVIKVPLQEASRFGIMSTDENGRITAFEEKPRLPKSNLASMGIYIFNRKILADYLEKDAATQNSAHDFGKNIIPALLNDSRRLFSYSFDGYWKDVGTIDSLWQANMDLLNGTFHLSHADEWRIYSSNPALPPHYIGPDGFVQNCLVSSGAIIYGTAKNSIIFSGVCIEEGAQIEDAVIMPFAKIKKGALIKRAIVAPDCQVGANYTLMGKGDIALIAEKTPLVTEQIV